MDSHRHCDGYSSLARLADCRWRLRLAKIQGASPRQERFEASPATRVADRAGGPPPAQSATLLLELNVNLIAPLNSPGSSGKMVLTTKDPKAGMRWSLSPLKS